MLWINEKACITCGKALQRGYSNDYCLDCKSVDHLFSKGYSCVTYGEKEKHILHDLKYRGKGYLASKLSEIMVERLMIEELNTDLMLPVPMNQKKKKERGYNQAELLCKRISGLQGIPCYNDVLVRVKETEPMNSLGRDARRENMKGAFSIKDKAEGIILDKNILLVDDIFTTGATLDECSKVLLEKGANRIEILTFASGLNNKYDNNAKKN